MNGCHNHAPHKDELVTHSVEIVWRSGHPCVEVVTRSFKNNFDRTCQYRKTEIGKADPGCVGCKWREE